MRQRLGQHFLRDQAVIQAILAAGNLRDDDAALEIGPGRGALTRPLAERVRLLTAIELDAALAKHLQARFAGNARVAVVEGDILRADLSRLVSAPVKIFGNLPYAITAPIFEKLLAWDGWRTGVFLVQKEVADRMRAAEGSRTYGLLSIAIQLFADVEAVRTVRPGAFVPPPDVASEVVRLRRRDRPGASTEERSACFDLARGAFAHRRKTMANSLSLYAGIAKPRVQEWLRGQGIDERARAESVRVDQYVKMAGPWSIFRREIGLTRI